MAERVPNLGRLKNIPLRTSVPVEDFPLYQKVATKFTLRGVQEIGVTDDPDQDSNTQTLPQNHRRIVIINSSATRNLVDFIETVNRAKAWGAAGKELGYGRVFEGEEAEKCIAEIKKSGKVDTSPESYPEFSLVP